jgi:hypothetical protein
MWGTGAIALENAVGATAPPLKQHATHLLHT